MKVNKILLSLPELPVVPLGNRLYKLAQDYKVTVVTDEGLFIYKFKKGFITNFRSGGLLVDGFVDQIGDGPEIQASWLIHDAAYTPCDAFDGEHPISRARADEILKACLLHAGMKPYKANIVYYSVRWFGGSAYEEDDELTESNSVLFTFDWN